MGAAPSKLSRCTVERSAEIVARVREIARDRIQVAGLVGRVRVVPNGNSLRITLSVPGATLAQRMGIERPMQDYLMTLCTPLPGTFQIELSGYSIDSGD